MGKSRKTGARKRKPDVREFVASMPNDKLVNLVLDLAREDEGLMAHLERQAALAVAQGTNSINKLLRTVDDALVTNYYLEEYERANYVSAIWDFSEQVEKLVEQGRAADAVELARYAVDRVRENWEMAEGECEVADAASDLAESHLKACEAAKADPVETAEWLAAHQLEDNTIPDLKLSQFEKILGSKGFETRRSH
ncbi:hypothetical protein [Salininema proteolyticum]|uniref:Uncharacterized protein n=1 Tax=Salininema proteolyticum TaxID=1607685 RepID=A0ABV8U2P0_9ACTN